MLDDHHIVKIEELGHSHHRIEIPRHKCRFVEQPLDVVVLLHSNNRQISTLIQKVVAERLCESRDTALCWRICRKHGNAKAHDGSPLLASTIPRIEVARN